MSTRIPRETRNWLDRFTKGRESGAGAAALLLEEARRRDVFPAIDFRDTSAGRLAYVQGSRVPVFLVGALGTEVSADEVRTHYGWPQWKAEAALAYAGAFPNEMVRDAQAWEACEDELPMRLPGIQSFPA